MKIYLVVRLNVEKMRRKKKERMRMVEEWS